MRREPSIEARLARLERIVGWAALPRPMSEAEHVERNLMLADINDELVRDRRRPK